MIQKLCDRFGQALHEGDMVAYGTRVGNVGETRLALVTSVRWVEKMGRGYHRVKVRALQPTYDTREWKLGRESEPNHHNLVRVELPDAPELVYVSG